MRQPEFTDEAATDLNDIHDYIKRNRVSAAERLVDLLEQTCETVAETPSRGARSNGARAEPP